MDETKSIKRIAGTSCFRNSRYSKSQLSEFESYFQLNPFPDAEGFNDLKNLKRERGGFKIFATGEFVNISA